jgi:curved DNA-binding protein CbpA
LLFQLHPDKHQNGETSVSSISSNDLQKEVHDKFVAVNTAYGILSKPRSKEMYDLSLSRDPADFPNNEHGRQRYRYNKSFPFKNQFFGKSEKQPLLFKEYLVFLKATQ